MRKLALVLLAAAALLGGACSDDPDRPPVTTDGTINPGIGGGGGVPEGGAPGGGTTDGGDAGACTDLPNTGGFIDQTAIGDDLPPGTGGVIADGVYDLTAVNVYRGLGSVGGATGASYQGSIRITAPLYERVIVFRNSASATSEVRSSGSFTTTGTNGTITLTCPIPALEQMTYSVVNNALTISNLGTNESFTFTRQL